CEVEGHARDSVMNMIIDAVLEHLMLAAAGVGGLAILALVLRSLVRRDAVLRYQIMVTALCAGAALLAVQLVIAESSSRARGTTREAVTISTPGEQAVDVPNPMQASMPIVNASQSPGHDAAKAFPSVLHSSSRGAAPLILFAVYLCGAALVLQRQVRGLMAARALLARCRTVSDARVLRIWGELVADMRRPPVLLECEGLHAPACRVIGRAAVIVPAPATRIDDEILAAALRHELVHLARRDGWVVLASGLASSLLWFQPLVWIFARVLETDREHSCDAIVVRATSRPRAYAHALLWFCEPRSAQCCPSPLLGFESSRSIQRRILMLSHALEPTVRHRQIALLLAGVAGLSATLTAHGHLTTAAGPDSLLAAATTTTNTTTDVGGAADAKAAASQPRMTAHVAALDEGRSEMQVYQRAVDVYRKQAPGGKIWEQAPRDGSWAFYLPNDEPEGGFPAGTRVTDEEPVLTVKEGQIKDRQMSGSTMRIRLPGGSKLKAVLEGETVRVERTPEQSDQVTVEQGTVRIVDERNATCLTIRTSSKSAPLVWKSVASSDGCTFEVRSSDAAASVIAEAAPTIQSAKAEGAHNTNGWAIIAPMSGTGLIEVRMQWFYDLGKMKRPDGC
ncbi:MAG: M56 family metallopeptidase, partial [Planctomycetota bacterium]|nr:M56 family metallopeptidase [Planctomycetota bacterium]